VRKKGLTPTNKEKKIMSKVKETKSKTPSDTKAAALANAEASQNKAEEAETKKASSKSESPVKVKTSLNSAVTSDLPNEPSAPARELTEADEAALDAVNNDPMQRAMDAGIGLIRPLGLDFDYVGLAPARDDDPKTPDGLTIAPSRATFTRLADVPFHPSTRVKDPTTGDYYFPADGVTSWEGCEYKGNKLIPEKADKAAVKARRQAKMEPVG
jgi:hypothetical protein